MGTYTSIQMDTYTTEEYTWAHTQVYGRKHTQQKDTHGHIHKYTDGHIHNRRIHMGSYTSIQTDTYTTEGYTWDHTQVYGRTHTQQKDTPELKDTRGLMHKYTDGHIRNRRIHVGSYTSIWTDTYTTE